MASTCIFSSSILFHKKHSQNQSRNMFFQKPSNCMLSSPILLHKKTSQNQSRNIFFQTFCSSQPRPMGVNTAEPIVRRSGNYQLSLWSFDYVESLTSDYKGVDNSEARFLMLKEVAKMIQNESKMENPLSCLELVDDLQRLGISYHFKDEISDVLEMIYYNYYKNKAMWDKMDLNLKALGFRLLRQHVYDVPKEIFHDIKDETGKFEASVCKDTLGLLNLYEASYLAAEDESILDEARDFTSNCLKKFLENDNVVDQITLALISHALELPLHWRVPRVEAKWYIEIYERRSGMNPLLAELAKLDFNIVQAIHQEDLKDSSRWWKGTCWDKKLHFARDRIVENFLWTIGVNYLPYFGTGRRALTKVNALITTIDDVYDVYGTLDELERFTNITIRWDINAIDRLPDYMKICFLGFYNAINEIAYRTLTTEGLLIISYFKKAWADLCKSYVVEAQWYRDGYIPTLEEYLNNAYVSIGAPVILTHVYFLTSSSFADKALERLETADNIIRCSSLILRLADDLGTSSDELEKGDNPKSIQCYMNERGATEDEARAYIKTLIGETWKKLNKERKAARDLLSSEFIECATNLGRMAQFMYSKGDGHGSPDLTISHVLSLLVNPIHV